MRALMIAAGGMLAISVLNASAADINRKPVLTKAPPLQPAPSVQFTTGLVFISAAMLAMAGHM